MSRNVVKRAARRIADEMISAARNSGSDPVAWVTGNSYMPPLRSFSDAEHIWQLPAFRDATAWESLTDRVEWLLADAQVYMTSPEWDNALYVVDLARFEYSENPDGETLQSDWSPADQAADDAELSRIESSACDR